MCEGDMGPALDHPGTSLPVDYTPFVFVGTTPQSPGPHFSNCLCGFVRLFQVVKMQNLVASPLTLCSTSCL